MSDFLTRMVDWGRENLSEWSMLKVYLACAVAGGTILIGQTGLNLFGLGGDTDVDPDVDVDDLEGDGGGLNFLSIRALAGFLTFFGLVGWGGTSAGWGPGLSVIAAFLAGSMVMVMVAVIMRFFRGLGSSGNMRSGEAIGRTASVYLRVPGAKQGKGKIQVNIGGRDVEFEAVTSGDELPTGSECKIVRMVTEGTFEVAPVDGSHEEE